MPLLLIHDLPLVAVAFGLAILAAGCWLLATRPARRTRVGRRGFVTFHPAHRAWLREQRLREAHDFLDLDALIVSGHPGRDVGRLSLGQAVPPRIVYLKREHGTAGLSRFVNFLAGFGWVAGPVREAQKCWRRLAPRHAARPLRLATGEDQHWPILPAGGGSGRSAVPLARALKKFPVPPAAAATSPLTRSLPWSALASCTEAGFFHYPRLLYAKHVLVGPDGRGPPARLAALRSRGAAWIRRSALHPATWPPSTPPCPTTWPAAPRAASPCCAYAPDSRLPPPLARLAREVQRETIRLLLRRHIREKRQPPPAAAQAWICLDGQALCITAAVLADLYPGKTAGWLALDRQPLPSSGGESRLWLALPDGRQALLVRRQGWPGLGCLASAAWPARPAPRLAPIAAGPRCCGGWNGTAWRRPGCWRSASGRCHPGASIRSSSSSRCPTRFVCNAG